MNPLTIEQTSKSPSVILDPVNMKFELEGESRPENATRFYDPIVTWLEQYKSVLYWQKDKFGTAPEMTFTFKFGYFNSTSAKFIVDILKKLEEFAEHGVNVKIKWHYDSRDVDMKESGEDLAQLIEVPFEFVENK